MASDPRRPMPAWLARLWPRGENLQRVLRLMKVLEPMDAQALASFLRDHAQVYRLPAECARSRSRAA